jgi:hypothetical protein
VAVVEVLVEAGVALHHLRHQRPQVLQMVVLVKIRLVQVVVQHLLLQDYIMVVQEQ